ncbi:hypothetical protein GAYE_SCF51G6103 [Galdieria yellowstonensis]|uniref:RWP-RK domain-containing protein n=1 Tax=Galdieria yellowstonensis TaxID=3028027 RepID=A0AAV9ILF5_9RHOD|nr:hypothetical protein GAYE_SCF51G6103 [Galdieria yellowstonensis]
MPKKNRTIIPLEKLQPFFDKPMAEASKELGICLTVIKSSCRAHGIPRWPYPEIQRIQSTLEHLRELLDSKEVITFRDEERFQLENRYQILQKQKQILERHPESLNKGEEWNQSTQQVENNLKSTKTKRIENADDQMVQNSHNMLSHITSNEQEDSSSTFLSHTCTNFGTCMEQFNDSRLQHMDPCFVFLKFILRIGVRGVRLMGPEIVTELAKVFYSASSAKDINQYEAEIEMLNARLHSLETKMEELKNQNDQIQQFLSNYSNC